MSNLKNYLFTSESVSEGHPDKVSDRISDMVVDSYLSGDPFSRVACETLTTTNKVVLAGEVRGPEIEKDELIEKVRNCRCGVPATPISQTMFRLLALAHRSTVDTVGAGVGDAMPFSSRVYITASPAQVCSVPVWRHHCITGTCAGATEVTTPDTQDALLMAAMAPHRGRLRPLRCGPHR